MSPVRIQLPDHDDYGGPPADVIYHAPPAAQPVWYELCDWDGAPLLDFDSAVFVDEIAPRPTPGYGAV